MMKFSLFLVLLVAVFFQSSSALNFETREGIFPLLPTVANLPLVCDSDLIDAPWWLCESEIPGRGGAVENSSTVEDRTNEVAGEVAVDVEVEGEVTGDTDGGQGENNDGSEVIVEAEGEGDEGEVADDEDGGRRNLIKKSVRKTNQLRGQN